ncbi:MAG: transposase [Thermoplasmatota archaeon]
MADPGVPGIGHYRRQLVQNTLGLLDHEDAVQRIDPDHFSVVGLRGLRRVNVSRRGDQWRCAVDKRNNQDAPCSHILAVLIYEGVVELPSSTEEVYRKGDTDRDHALETRAWELVPTRLPAILAKLLAQGLPVISPDLPHNPRGGEPVKPFYPKFYQAIMRAGFLRKSLRCTRGDMANHRDHNPYGSVGIATQSRFMAQPATEVALEKLQLLTLWPVRAYETLVHPDGTGLTEQHFSAYFDERYAKDRKKQKALRDGKKAEGPRKHHWSYAEILWTYRYTMVAAIHTSQQQFGEAPWLIPLMERARIMLDIKEVGGDKAYDANYIYRYAREHGIDAQIKVRNTPFPSYSSRAKKYRKAHMLGARLDPTGFAAKANRRNNAETGNHAFKAILGDQIYSKSAQAQRCEILCMCIAYNLTRLVLVEETTGRKVDFAAGLGRLSSAPQVGPGHPASTKYAGESG